MSVIDKIVLGVALFATVLLVGCQTAPITDPSSPNYLPPSGTIFQLRQPVTIRPQSARTFIQNGEAIGGTGQYYPGCNLWVRDLSDQPQTIERDDFVITKVDRFQDCVVLVSRNDQQLAGIGVVAGWRDRTDCRYVTRMNLKSPEQPDVFKLECQKLDEAALGRHITFDEIRLTTSRVGKFVHADGTPYPPAKRSDD